MTAARRARRCAAVNLGSAFFAFALAGAGVAVAAGAAETTASSPRSGMNVITAETKMASSAPVATTPMNRMPQSRTPLRRGGSRTCAALTPAMVADATNPVNRSGPMTDNLRAG